MTGKTKSRVVDPTERRGLFNFDDIPLYCRAELGGRLGYVLDKGHHVSEVVDARHIYIEFDDGGDATLHENIVNKYLRQSRDLWIDFDFHLLQATEETDDAIN